MKKRILALCLVVGLLAVSVIGGTLAYFTDSDKVENTFTVGKVDIILDEADTDEMGIVKQNEEGEALARVKANEYKLIPGHTYVKDPTVTVAAKSEPCYVYVEIENGLVDVLEALPIDTVNWESVTNDAGMAVYRYKAVVTASTDKVVLPAVFADFTVLEEANEEALNECSAEKIVVNAFAIQSNDLSNNVTTADAEAVAYFNSLNA